MNARSGDLRYSCSIHQWWERPKLGEGVYRLVHTDVKDMVHWGLKHQGQTLWIWLLRHLWVFPRGPCVKDLVLSPRYYQEVINPLGQCSFEKDKDSGTPPSLSFLHFPAVWSEQLHCTCMCTSLCIHVRLTVHICAPHCTCMCASLCTYMHFTAQQELHSFTSLHHGVLSPHRLVNHVLQSQKPWQ